MRPTSLRFCAVRGTAGDPLTARVHTEPRHSYRAPFQRDRDRIIHSRAFRRLAGKTQVFTHRSSDHFRSRLTHTIEVTQIARTVAAALELNEDLCETLALAHDIGHPPFGHAGEQALDGQLRPYGLRFDHNLHALRVVEFFEQRYAAFRGLNLTFAVREGIIKHSRDYPPEGYPALREYLLESRPPLEAQLIDLADEIAYLTADMDDGMEAGILDAEDLCANVALFARFYQEASQIYSAEPKLLANEALRRMLNALVDDLVAHTYGSVRAQQCSSVADVRSAAVRLAQLSPEMEQLRAQAKQYLFCRLYHAEDLARGHALAEEAIAGLFRYWMQNPGMLPATQQAQAAQESLPRAIADYLAAMTDTYCIEQWRMAGGCA
jgi:dGTPase